MCDLLSVVHLNSYAVAKDCDEHQRVVMGGHRCLVVLMGGHWCFMVFSLFGNRASEKTGKT